ncbi:DMT family transporter [Actinobacillus suis]|uniref:Drug/metabolite transporter (DMT) superfamily permease n=1 Tax=Actinobacillus suis H91-0380 TaxID=696748 RepID=K0G3F0_ACTSU|nr:DMT family transporter [Actinobacillus suis]AFU18164.1 drug/metabolite transporter (DMT) superfamily permease [Actinobacillus suis H91-0380]AIJ30298.1 drug/metabolite transporter (DMT) superfamily permease [Actinobacillus suis ATCC 33415]SNV24695.1 drug/metabolite transporter (DMT) superfamily permease [Actinobacillus suis]
MQQRPLLGFSLALLATATWGSLPMMAQQVLKYVDAQTLVWSRFVVAAAVLGLLLLATYRLPKLAKLTLKDGGGCLGVIGLSINFVLFADALNYISPTTDQVLWQLAPFTMILCGVLFFKEQLKFFQKIGFALLVIGLIAFFNDHFDEILQFDTYAWGILLGSGASTIWVIYGIAQKLLLRKLSSQQVLMIIYIGCSLLLAPLATPTELEQLRGFPLICFIYCCCNTLVGYGAYGEALNHWDTSKVSVVTTMIPVFTMIFAFIGHYFFPNTFDNPDMNLVSYIGAFIVVIGAMLAAVGDKLLVKKSEK